MANAKQNGSSRLITLMGISFPSQSKAADYVRQCINGTDMEFEACSQLWMELLSRHPESIAKIGCGVAGFIRERGTINGHWFIKVVRVDGTSIDFSWRKCLSSKATSMLGNIKAAMRGAVWEDISRFKTAELVRIGNSGGIGAWTCPLCGIGFQDRATVHVDHIESFDGLAEKWIKINPSELCELDDDPVTNQAKFKSKEVVEKWRKWHDAQAQLRLICQKCNLSRPRSHWGTK